jgi:uncharacterized protein (TIGR02231 family)
MKITHVIVMEDRAQVERRGTVSLPGGVSTIELPDFPLVAVDQSLRVEATNATVHAARLVRRWKQKATGGLPLNASELHTHVQHLVDRQYGSEADVYRLSTRRDGLTLARQALLQSIGERTGYGETDTAAWEHQLDSLSQQQKNTDEALRLAQASVDSVKRELSASRQAMGMAEEQPEDLECVLVLTVEGQGDVAVRVSYLVPCAVWRPAYRATLSGDEVEFESEAVVWQRTGETWPEVQLDFSTTRPTLGTTPPSLQDDWLSLRQKTVIEKRVVDVSLREEVIQSAGEISNSSAELPGLDDGGEARLLSAPGKSTVPSDGQPHRVPLGKFTTKAAIELVCPSEFSTLAFTVVRVPNEGGSVLLAGPVDLIRSAGFVGRSLVSFTAPGETMMLSFGSEDGVRVTRVVGEKLEEARLTGRRTTKKTVTLYVSNASTTPKTLLLEERVFVSEVKDVEVQVLQKECDPAPSPASKEGITRIEVALAANATKKVTFVWEVSTAAKVAGL